MSDANVPLPREPDSSETRGGRSSEWEVPSPWTSKPEPKSKSESKSKPKSDQSDRDWQTVNFPSAINVDTIPPAAANQQPAAPPTSPANPSEREVELLKLVGDLNQCNDSLLKRIAQLEETLENSQAALQSEIERTQESRVPPGRVLQPAANPNVQVAQLVSELDSTQQVLQRQKILTETLQAQLETSQQRVAQLDRECALIRQRYTKQSQTLMETEAACRDLRARLQRQQHYTLQFKAALEKSLEMPANGGRVPPVLSGDDHNAQTSDKGGSPQPISMPKAQRIQPWSADAAACKQAPNLDVLINGLSAVSTSGSGASTSSTPLAQVPVVDGQSSKGAFPPGQALDNPDSETAMLSWRDMEKLIEGARQRPHDGSAPATSSDSPEPSAPTLEDKPDKSMDKPSKGGFKLPLKSPLKLKSSAPPAAAQSGEPQFTEPSPWGAAIKAIKPSSSPSATPPESPANDESADDRSEPAAPQSTDSLPSLSSSSSKLSLSMPILANQSVEPPPALNPEAVGNSPSPIVYPLRPQKKIKSLAAVELPNFPRSQRR
ncbi:MAG: hypothetical protein QNJ46_17905 [Leptolyngbyaceae cyanobacterium MO_188.B28]|nr:hypothetical protein [Leptolyngbyaceae cyanobacterium MO_188.B28]